MAVFVTEGQLSSLRPHYERLTWKPDAIVLGDHLIMTYAQMYRVQPAIRAVTGFLARNLASGIPRYLEIDKEGNEAGNPNHPLIKMFRAPLPGTKLTRYRLLRDMAMDVLLYDDAYWLKIQPEDGTVGRPGLLRVPPRYIRPKVDEATWWKPKNYTVAMGGEIFPVKPEHIVHFTGYNPDGEMQGISPMESLREVLETEMAAGAYRKQLWRNGARTSGYLARPEGAPRWEDADKRRFKRAWKQLYAADGPEAGGTPILEDGMEWRAAGMTPKDAQYVESRELTKHEVAESYWCPPAVLSMLDQTTMPLEDQRSLLYGDTLGPWCEQFCQDIDTQLLPDVAGSSTGRTIIDFNEKLKGNFAADVAATVSAVGRPWMTGNEGRARRGLPPSTDPSMDEVIAPLNVTAGGLANPRDTAPDNPDNAASNGQPDGKPAAPATQKPGGGGVEKEPAPKVRNGSHGPKRAKMHVPNSRYVGNALHSVMGKQLRAIAGELGKARGKTMPNLDDLFNQSRWDAELGEELYQAAVKVTTASASTLLGQLGYSGSSYDVARTEAWLKAHADAVATATNGNTFDKLASVQDQAAGDVEAFAAGVKDAFAGWLGADGRADSTADAETRGLAGWGSDEAVSQVGATPTKTWIAGYDARRSHAINETVNFGENFSNGARWPGDSQADDMYGCNCDMAYGVE